MLAPANAVHPQTQFIEHLEDQHVRETPRAAAAEGQADARFSGGPGHQGQESACDHELQRRCGALLSTRCRVCFGSGGHGTVHRLHLKSHARFVYNALLIT
jgi:hypothetical protein